MSTEENCAAKNSAAENDADRKPESPRRKLRYVWIVLAVVIGIASLCAPIVVRHQGFQRIRAIEAKIAAAGDWVTLEQYLDAVEIEESLQEEYWRWSERYKSSGIFEIESHDELLNWLSSPPGTPEPHWIRDILAEHSEITEEGRNLLRRKGLVLSSHGWASIDLAPGATIQEIACLRTPSLLVLRNLVRYLGTGALVAENADTWLRDLDSLIAACNPSSSLIHGRILSALGALRDEAYLNCCIRGNASAQQFESWLEQEPRSIHWQSNAMRGERILWLRSLPHSRLSDIISAISNPLATNGFWEEVGDVLKIPWLWVGVPHDIALGIETYYLIERRLRGDLTVDLDPNVELSQQAWTSIHDTIIYSRKKFVAWAVNADANHRIVRLAARLLLDVKKGKPLPGSIAEFRKRYPGQLDGSENLFALEYLPGGPDRFRLSADLGPRPRNSLLRLAATESSVGPPPAGELETVYETAELAIDVWIPAWFTQSEEANERPARRRPHPRK